MPGIEAAIPALLAGVAGLFGGGGGKQSNEAVAAQLGLSRTLMDMLQRQQNVALPYQQSLLTMLQGRAQQQFPVRRPGDVPVFNPFGASPMQSQVNPQPRLPLGPYLQRPVSAVRTGRPALGGG